MDNPQSYSNDAIKLLESMTQSILITTPELDSPGPYIIYVNKAFEEMTGWSREEIIGKSPRILQGTETDKSIFRNLGDILDKGEVWEGKTINYKKDGTKFNMEWSIAPIFDSNGEFDQLLAVQNDITENVKIEKRLEKARKGELKRVKEIEKANIKLNYLTEKQKKTLDLFIKYVPESVVKKALSNTKKDIKEGVKLDVSLLFCDIRNFTSMVGNMNPQGVVRMLDTYYSKMTEVIKMYNGVINQFTGDEIFVTFGAPIQIKDPEISSAYCAIEMIKKLEEINKDLKDILPQELTIGIGLNYGSIIAGNLGSDDRLTYAITGDAVNTAKRIESLTRDLSNAILISESIYEKIKAFISTKPWGEVSVKGKEKKIKVYQLI
ncbi:MAG: adenylate/guanylate cyclase domain-containing protein [Aureibaculum sp.]|nr:adenylate/guanylate cyclase domain-containing protein [Aureibaculum sp.]